MISDIGELNSPLTANVGSRSTRVDPKLFGPNFSGDRREWRHFEWVFRNWFGFFLHDAAEEWLDQAASAPGELGEAVPDPQRDGHGVVHESGYGV